MSLFRRKKSVDTLNTISKYLAEKKVSVPVWQVLNASVAGFSSVVSSNPVKANQRDVEGAMILYAYFHYIHIISSPWFKRRAMILLAEEGMFENHEVVVDYFKREYDDLLSEIAPELMNTKNSLDMIARKGDIHECMTALHEVVFNVLGVEVTKNNKAKFLKTYLSATERFEIIYRNLSQLIDEVRRSNNIVLKESKTLV